MIDLKSTSVLAYYKNSKQVYAVLKIDWVVREVLMLGITPFSTVCATFDEVELIFTLPYTNDDGNTLLNDHIYFDESRKEMCLVSISNRGFLAIYEFDVQRLCDCNVKKFKVVGYKLNHEDILHKLTC